LSEPYTTNLDFEVKFINQPDSTLLLSYSPKKITIEVNGHGFNLFSHYFNSKPIEVDLSKLNNKGNDWFDWDSNENYSEIVGQFPYDARIEKINTDRIRFNMVQMSRKRVPFSLQNELNVNAGFVLDTIYFKPDSTWIIGPVNELKSFDSFPIGYVNEQELNQDISSSIKIETRNYWEIELDKVELIVLLDNFTQGKIKVPILISNAPHNSKVKLFPDEVEVLFNIPTKDYHTINPNDFIIKADFNALDSINGKVHLELLSSPESVEMMALKPNEIDYLFIYQ